MEKDKLREDRKRINDKIVAELRGRKGRTSSSKRKKKKISPLLSYTSLINYFKEKEKDLKFIFFQTSSNVTKKLKILRQSQKIFHR